MDLYSWYHNPGEKLRSLGFYCNPYKRLGDAKFSHIFAFDTYNMYVGQFSVYPEHLEDMFETLKEKKLEYGFITLTPEGAVFDGIEDKNIIYLNARLKIVAQRLYDYGLSEWATLRAKNVDLGDPSIRNILKGKYLQKPADDKI